jgi:UDP:flavonoid glycosyltransferase YjiC (YdhE family)
VIPAGERLRVLFATGGAYGHLFPVLPLALAARAAGHEVAVATDGSFHPLLAAAGLRPVQAGMTVRAAVALARADAAPPDAAALAFGSVMPRQVVTDLVPVLAADPPDLVVYEVLNPGAAMAARLAGGIPVLCHGIGRVSGGPSWAVMADIWVGTAIGLGIAVPDQNRAFLGACFLDICPPSLQLPGFADGTARLPLRPVAWNPPAPRPALAGRGRERSRPRRPLIYLTFGTTFARPELLQQALDGLARLPADVLAATGPATAAAGLGEVPPNVSVLDWVPQADLLPEVDLVVSHGGSGTVLAALAAGRPQLVLPQGADQFSNARAVAGAGAGRMIMPAELSADRIAADARALLDDAGVRARAGELAGEIAALPAPAQVARDLGRLAAARLAH